MTSMNRWIAAACAVGAASVALAGPASAQIDAAGDKFRMPNVVGMVLQDAQDLLQSRGSYILDQKDAKGWGRWQLLDSGWKVCSQRPRPGVVVPADTMVRLWSVKLSERCP
jgi:beta-lactam-binding protein with PASTA domain